MSLKRVWGAVLALLLGSRVFAVAPDAPIHWSGDKTLWNPNLDKVELIGNATVHQQDESLTADYIQLDIKNRMIDAKGNVVYYSADTVVFSDELHFNFETHAGSIVSGRVTNGKFILLGERINRLSKYRFQTHNAEYTTCIDCPAAWSMYADDVDMEIEGYAYLTDVTTKVKDAPLFWMPYMVIPIKTKRQTGLLFPKYGISPDNHGQRFVLPFFWATSRSTDMTIGVGTYTERGRRLEWEGRYQLADRSSAVVNAFIQEDKKGDFMRKRGPREGHLLDPELQINKDNRMFPLSEFSSRWALSARQEQGLPFGFTERARIRAVSDSFYPQQFTEDMDHAAEPALQSNMILFRESNNIGVHAEAKYLRSLLNYTQPKEFDPRTVQLMPRVQLDAVDRKLPWVPVKGGVTLAYDRFSRGTNDFDFDCEFDQSCPINTTLTPVPGSDPLRKADRLSLIPKAYIPFRPLDIFAVVPSVEYRGHAYNFGSDSRVSDTWRGYLLGQTELSFQLERIYHTRDPEIPRTKHLIRPRMLYSRILSREEDKDHPFIRQVAKRDGYVFDNNDIVPLRSGESLQNYFVPLGHSISFGGVTQLVRRREVPEKEQTYFQRTVEFSADQTVDILEFQHGHQNQVRLSRLSSGLILDFDHFKGQTQYYYYPYIGNLIRRVTDKNARTVVVPDPSPNELITQWQYVFVREKIRELYEFERSVSLGYTFKRLSNAASNINVGGVYSLNDFFMMKGRVTYDMFDRFSGIRRFSPIETSLVFQSPARCWRVQMDVRWQDREESGSGGFSYNFDLTLNLTGTGFGGVTEAGGVAGIQ